MKKTICLLLAAISVVSLAACSKDPEAPTTTQAPTGTTTITQPNVLLEDLLTINGDIKFSNDEKVDEGYIYTYFVDGVDYAGLKDYVSQLEAAGFSIYHANPLDTETTDDILPDTLEEGVHTKSWRGKRRGLYVVINWYADEYYENSDSSDTVNVYLRFYTYNIFDNTAK